MYHHSRIVNVFILFPLNRNINKIEVEFCQVVSHQDLETRTLSIGLISSIQTVGLEGSQS